MTADDRAAGVIAADERVLFARDGDAVFVLELAEWRVIARATVGGRLATELEEWNLLPDDAATRARRDAIAERLSARPELVTAVRRYAGADADGYRARMDLARRFAALHEEVIPLPSWHRLALARHAIFHQRFAAWGIPDAAGHWPLFRVDTVAPSADPPRDPGVVVIVDDLAVDESRLAAFERDATSAGLTRLHLADDGAVLRLGPTLEGGRLGDLPARARADRAGVPLARVTAALIETELLKIAPRISAALTGESSITKGRVFRLDWRTMEATEERLEPR